MSEFAATEAPADTSLVVGAEIAPAVGAVDLEDPATDRVVGESENIKGAIADDHAFFRRHLPEAAILTLNKDHATVVIM